MESIELINLICPEHTRTTCSDENISNGFYVKEEYVISTSIFRCTRCAMLEIANGKIELTEENKNSIKYLFGYL